jgi:hypothetical protein
MTTHRVRERILRSAINTVGYPFVSVHEGARQVTLTIHQLVLAAFGPPKPYSNARVRHKDDDKLNPHIDNLEWGSQLDNMQDAIRNGRIPRGEARSNAKLTPDKVLELRSLAATGMNYSDLGRKFGVSPASCRDILLGKSWRHV